TRLEEGLAYVGETPVRAAGGHVGVEGDDRNASGDRLGCRRVERLWIDKAYGDAVRLLRDGGLHRADHLGDNIFLGAGPLIAAPKGGAGVLDAIDAGSKELVERDMADKVELVVLLRQTSGRILSDGRADPAAQSGRREPQRRSCRQRIPAADGTTCFGRGFRA